MRVKLSKIELPEDATIDALNHDDLLALAKLWRVKISEYQSILFRVRRNLFGRKSEKSERPDAAATESPEPSKPRSDTKKRPSDRYPDAPIREDKRNFAEAPSCGLCGSAMSDSGMTEDSEYLDVQTREFTVVQQKRHKHRCHSCHGSIVTAPAPPRVTPGGSYSDDLIIDATLSKYCDLIPMERYCQMAARSGLPGLPPHSLIQASFTLADYLKEVYQLIKAETLATSVLLADETPHRMLEGDAKKRWYLWGFANHHAAFFECHDTRSGDVSTEVLVASTCSVLLTDAFCGYKKSIKAANAMRADKGLAPIRAAYCNAHARRRFYSGSKEEEPSADAAIIVKLYQEIYRLNAESRGLSNADILQKRAEMVPYFEAIKLEAESKIDSYSSKSTMGSSYSYFLKYYDGLTLFVTNPLVPIDNNPAERLLRSPVVGRKTWYGTHSKAGAEAAAVHFSIVETCKMNGVNPREYYADAVARVHGKRELITPRQFRDSPDTGSG